jgi:hypothetical protein
MYSKPLAMDDNWTLHSGVYQLTCRECGKKYKGQTDRSFKTKYSAHLRALKYNTTKSNFAQQILDYGPPSAGYETGIWTGTSSRNIGDVEIKSVKPFVRMTQTTYLASGSNASETLPLCAGGVQTLR